MLFAAIKSNSFCLRNLFRSFIIILKFVLCKVGVKKIYINLQKIVCDVATDKYAKMNEDKWLEQRCLMTSAKRHQFQLKGFGERLISQKNLLDNRCNQGKPRIFI